MLFFLHSIKPIHKASLVSRSKKTDSTSPWESHSRRMYVPGYMEFMAMFLSLSQEKRTTVALFRTKKATSTFLPGCMHQKMVGFKFSKSELQDKVQRNSKATKLKLRQKGHHIEHLIRAQ